MGTATVTDAVTGTATQWAASDGSQGEGGLGRARPLLSHSPRRKIAREASQPG